jgi:hypothetical protein
MELSSMTTTDPWQVLFKRFDRQKSAALQEWLSRWVFANDGAALIVERANKRTAPATLEEKPEQAVLILLTKGRWQTTLH